MKSALVMTEAYRHRAMTELAATVKDQLKNDPRSAQIDPDDYEVAVQAIVETILGEAEIENSGPVERMGNEIADRIVTKIRARSNDDFLMDLVLYNRFLQGEESETPQSTINCAIATVRWLGKTRRVFT